MDHNDGRCKGCKYARTINSTEGWQFVGCICEPYKGKWVVEIENCPMEEQRLLSKAFISLAEELE